MRTDNRFSRMLHVLLHMARHDQPFTSEQIAKMLTTSSVVVRRTMAGLRNAGYVTSEKGRGGGWKIACDLKATTLLDIYHAVGKPRLLAIDSGEANPTCAVEKVVTSTLGSTFQQAEALIIKELGNVTLNDLLVEFDIMCQNAGWGKDGPTLQSNGYFKIDPS